MKVFINLKDIVGLSIIIVGGLILLGILLYYFIQEKINKFRNRRFNKK